MFEDKLQAFISQYDFSRYILHQKLLDASRGDLFRARMLVGLSVVCLAFVPTIYLYMVPSLSQSLVIHSIGYALLLIGAIISLGVLRFVGSFRLAA
ncbi:MAG: hypothetical protein M3Q07_26990, partial [Pseudobdellovibrionaceae bacterium]|nr:hypothetical protein [Pseudobdellovibrionaceae bacterium]